MGSNKIITLLILALAYCVTSRFPHRKPIKTRKITEKFLQSSDDVPYTTHYYETKLNNFEFDSSETFLIRYLVADSFYKPGGPLLFYCGNEESIMAFWQYFGFLKKNLAEQFNALVIFAEHRFFGESYPRKPENQNYKYLSIEQALEDYVHLIHKYKQDNPIYADAKVIGFGGSYGGMLSAWARMKYPNVFAGSIASSAPILLFGKPSERFNKIVTETYAYYHPQCPVLIREGFNVLYEMEQNTSQEDLDLLNELFPGFNLTNSSDIVNLDQNILENVFEACSQYNYPFDSIYSGFQFPPYPANISCSAINPDTNITDKLELLYVLRNATDIAYHWDTRKNIASTSFQMKIPNNLSQGYNYLICTEMVMPIYQDGVHDMFNPVPWNLTTYIEGCNADGFKFDIRPYDILDNYGGRNPEVEFQGYSNILFVNGLFDPYRAGCPSEGWNNSTFAFEAISAHHLDLFTPTPNDPPSIIQARELEIQLITKWINE